MSPYEIYAKPVIGAFLLMAAVVLVYMVFVSLGLIEVMEEPRG